MTKTRPNDRHLKIDVRTLKRPLLNCEKVYIAPAHLGVHRHAREISVLCSRNPCGPRKKNRAVAQGYLVIFGECANTHIECRIGAAMKCLTDTDNLNIGLAIQNTNQFLNRRTHDERIKPRKVICT